MSINKSKFVIHRCCYSDMKSFQFSCYDENEWTEPLWGKQPQGLPENVYQADNHEYYSFYDSCVTCNDCKNKIHTKVND